MKWGPLSAVNTVKQQNILTEMAKKASAVGYGISMACDQRVEPFT